MSTKRATYLFMDDYELLIETDLTSIDLQIITLLQEEFDGATDGSSETLELGEAIKRAQC